MWSSDDEWVNDANLLELGDKGKICSVPQLPQKIKASISPSNNCEISDRDFLKQHSETEDRNTQIKTVHLSTRKNDNAVKKNNSSDKPISRMALNDNKAGMDGLDKEKINKIIHEASKGSKFYQNELRKEKQLEDRVKRQQSQLAKFTHEQMQTGRKQADKVLLEIESIRDLSRTLVHVDMDMFYAAVEMRDEPSLREKPMAVGGNSMISTSNYIARRFGVRAGMPGFIGRKLCSELILVRPHFHKYKTVSKQVQRIFATYDPNFSMMSLDEGYLDFTSHLIWRQNSDETDRTVPIVWKNNEMCLCNKYRPKYSYDDDQSVNQDKSEEVSSSPDLFEEEEATDEHVKASGENLPDLCQNCDKRVFKNLPFDSAVFGLNVDEAVKEMRFRIEQTTHLTASAGIAPNTLLSKICSDYNKPNGQYRVLPTRENVIRFIEELPIRKISGIGKVCEKMLAGMGIKLCKDLYEKRAELRLISSDISFHYYMKISLGIGSTFVSSHGERKSMSVERTFREISDGDELSKKCLELSKELAEDLKRHNLMGKTVTLKIKKCDFSVKTRAQTVSNLTDDFEIIFKTANDLLETERVNCKQLNLRLMGVRMSGLQDSYKAASKQNDIKTFLTNMKKKAIKRDGEKPKEIKVKKRATNNLKDMFAKIKQTRNLSDQDSDNDDIVVVYEKK